MTAPVVALFCVSMRGHWGRMAPILTGLRRRGATVHAYVPAWMRAEVEQAGAVFEDLYGRFDHDAVDAQTYPHGCRQLSFAAAFAEPLAAELAARGVGLIVHDAFAVLGHVLGHRLGLPAVSVRAGHNRNGRVVESVKREAPRTHIGPACLAAGDTLGAWGLPDVTPYFYLSHLSRQMNLYSEPPEFLTADERRGFEPVAFFGSVHPERSDAARRAANSASARGATDTGWPDLPGASRVYVSLGTQSWEFYPDENLERLEVLAEALSLRDVSARLTLGGHAVDDATRRRLSRPNVRVETDVDQWAVLASADLFITHHGLNSTHEAVWHGVPMLSCPLFSDQPGLAARCQELGLALPLTTTPRAPFGVDDVHAALGRLADAESDMRTRLARAQQWERDVLAGRDAVLDDLLALAR